MFNVPALVAALEKQGWVFHNYIYNGEWYRYENVTQAVKFSQGENCCFVFTRPVTTTSYSGEKVSVHQVGTVAFEKGKYKGCEMVGAWQQRVNNSRFQRTVEQFKGE